MRFEGVYDGLQRIFPREREENQCIERTPIAMCGKGGKSAGEERESTFREYIYMYT